MTALAIPSNQFSTIVRFIGAATRLSMRTYFHFFPTAPRCRDRRNGCSDTAAPRTALPGSCSRTTADDPLEAGHLAVWQTGPENAPAVLLVHGWGGIGAQLSGFVPPLLARGFA